MRARNLHLAQCLILLLAAAATITQPRAFAQQTAPSTATAEAEPPEPIGPSFEVASIRPTTQDGRNWGGFQLTPGGRLTASRVRVASLVGFSYGAKPLNTMVVGGPKWAESDQFDISAKVDDAQMAGWDKLSDAQRMEKVKPMIRTLLAERFHLKLHVEMRVMPVDVLVQTKGGAKLKEVAPPPPTSTSPEAQERAKADRAAGKAPPGGFMMTGGTWTGNACSMGILAAQIGGNSGNDRPVVDETGLKGFYDFTFKDSRDENGPTFEQQLEDQLGLKLEPRKVPIKTYVIDSVDKPSVDGAELREPPPATLRSAAFVQEKPTPPPPTDAPYVPTMTFDVASIRESKPDYDTGFSVGGNFAPNSTSLKLTNFDAHNLLNMAYGGQFDEVSGIPPEFNRAMFNIQAKSDSDADEKLAKLSKEQAGAERQHMVQTLLADRFKLKVHFDTKQGPNYDLVVSKKGRLSETTGAPPSPEELKRFGDRPIPPLYQQGSSRTEFHYIANACTMQYVANMLATQFGRPVVDKTGLTGKYDFDLKYHDTRSRDRRDDDTNPIPPLDTAIQDQLGLKLEPSTGPIRVLVIDHIEKPSEN